MTEQEQLETSNLDTTDAASRAVQKTPNRVSLDSIKAKVVEVQYINPVICPHMTIALVKMANGFILLGDSTPADAANFNALLGQQFAYENALRKAWPLEAYLLRERLEA